MYSQDGIIKVLATAAWIPTYILNAHGYIFQKSLGNIYLTILYIMNDHVFSGIFNNISEVV